MGWNKVSSCLYNNEIGVFFVSVIFNIEKNDLGWQP
nr:MAG TPA: hypothetical protein [Caudoviricetes sp.]